MILDFQKCLTLKPPVFDWSMCAYPPPLDAPVPPAVLYPAYQDNDEVEWLYAQAMIMNGQVERVVQTHALKVTLFPQRRQSSGEC